MKRKTLAIAALAFAVAAAALTKLALANTTGNILPSADGTYLQWTPSVPPTTTPHYTMVDETLCNGTDDYNYTNTVGGKDSYAVDISSIPLGATITTISITPCASANLLNTSTPATSSMALFYRLNGGFESALGPNYNFDSWWNTPWLNATPTIFSGLGIIKQSTSTLEVGAKLISGMAGARLSQVIVNISYSGLPIVGATSVVSTTRTSTSFYSYVNPNGANTTGWFRYGSTSPGTCNDTFGTRAPAIGGVNLGNGYSPVQYFYYNAPISPDTIYYYCAIAENAMGKSFGSLKSFKSPL